jgi:hypothetical protein
LLLAMELKLFSLFSSNICYLFFHLTLITQH